MNQLPANFRRYLFDRTEYYHRHAKEPNTLARIYRSAASGIFDQIDLTQGERPP
jgi:hypothetical protein